MNTLRFLLFFLSIPALLCAQQNNPPANVPAPVGASTTTQPAIANPKTPEEFFARARQWSDLEAAGIPFHLKATYIATGDTEFTGKGTYEEWWQSKNVWRKEAMLDDYKYVQIKNDTKIVTLASSTYTPLRVRQIMDLKIFHVALPQDNHEHWKMSSQADADNTLGIAIEKAPCSPKVKWIVCTQEYKFAVKGSLQSYRNNDVSETYSDFQQLGKLLFPRKLVVSLLSEPVDTATINSLETLTESDSRLFDAEPIPGLHAVPSGLPEKIPVQGMTPPKFIYAPHMRDPKSEHKTHPEAAIIECSIDTTGAVREPFILLSGDTAFDDAALQYLRQSTFSPGIYDGQPVTADLRAVVLFHRHKFF